MILAEAATESVSPSVIGLWVLAAGVVLNALLGAAKLWKTLHGDPERRAVNVLAEHATKDEVKSVAADVSELRREWKIDRDALTKAAEERARYLNLQINDVLAAVNKVSGVVDRMRDELRPGRTA